MDFLREFEHAKNELSTNSSVQAAVGLGGR